jgi:hypothetical protein
MHVEFAHPAVALSVMAILGMRRRTLLPDTGLAAASLSARPPKLGREVWNRLEQLKRDKGDW